MKTSIAHNSFHHGRWTAALNHVKMFILEHGVIGDKSLLTGRTVFCSDKNAPIFAEFVQL